MLDLLIFDHVTLGLSLLVLQLLLYKRFQTDNSNGINVKWQYILSGDNSHMGVPDDRNT